ncbi:flagellar biosynthesis protein FlhB [Pseudomethylobacillus aquaticus]|uniref:Flagellar biosynthetic protein FlhB n=1 Tax=Pseudomethylobacillus aquaticus TaxID=2676064 RepID=A0A3N0V064_9PROT|nr:flagellar biosynthesis protein FlhB [Pseudomethylobacillus aquaticus]ROH85891.1 flagellar biosynthesis protein FlhB [Pseudomethylobacillus aquaticus]
MAEQDQNRNEAATPHKLEEARKKGSVPKSLDVNSWMVLATALIVLYIWGDKIVEGELMLAHQILSNSHHATFGTGELAGHLAALLAEALLMLAPLFLLLMAFGALANFMQVGPIFTFFPLKPDLARINPITGFKRLFSVRFLIESIKTILKFILLGWVLYSVVAAALPKFIISSQVHSASIGSLLIPVIIALLFKLLLALVFIALIDLVFSKWDYAKQLRMSRRDITDEHKRREGDPRIRARLRELQREAVKRARSMGRVKEADVLITNPTHIAIAVKYDRDTVDAPLVIAKGAGFLAARMRYMARKHHVPIVENKVLARQLFHQVAIEQAVPVEHYSVVAKILFWAYSLRNMPLPARRSS